MYCIQFHKKNVVHDSRKYLSTTTHYFMTKYISWDPLSLPLRQFLVRLCYYNRRKLKRWGWLSWLADTLCLYQNVYKAVNSIRSWRRGGVISLSAWFRKYNKICRNPTTRIDTPYAFTNAFHKHYDPQIYNKYVKSQNSSNIASPTSSLFPLHWPFISNYSEGQKTDTDNNAIYVFLTNL
jgi:hypothetical protein